MRRPLACLLAILALVPTACGEEDDSGTPDAGRDAPTTTRERETGGCEDVRQPAAKPDGGATKPKRPLAPGKVYEVVLATTCGEITFRLDQETSPRTAASFASLVEAGFYDETVFHRIVPGFVIQGGDPTATGTGGPGYSTRDVPPADTAYVKGVVAMAKSAAEAPGTAGSQFYIVTAPDAGLPPEYAVLGKVVKGQDVADAIEALGDPASGGAGTPLRPVVIHSAKLEIR